MIDFWQGQKGRANSGGLMMVDEKIKEIIKNLAIEGLRSDIIQHKQWFFEQIIETVGYDLKKIRQDLLSLSQFDESDDDIIFWARSKSPFEENND